MRWLSFLIVAVLLHDMFIPHRPPLYHSASEEAGISVPDFCHSPLSNLASDDETPGAFGPFTCAVPVFSFDYLSLAGHPLIQSLPPSETYQPPEGH